MRLTSWLREANGWRRLWFVLSVFLLGYMGLIFPFVETADSRLASAQFNWAVEKDYKNPECKPYFEKPISDLPKPKYQDASGGACWHIFTHRDIYSPNKVPYTLDDYKAHQNWEHWRAVLMLAGIGIVFSVVVSLLVYFLGYLTAWVGKGFKNKS